MSNHKQAIDWDTIVRRFLDVEEASIGNAEPALIHSNGHVYTGSVADTEQPCIVYVRMNARELRDEIVGKVQMLHYAKYQSTRKEYRLDKLAEVPPCGCPMEVHETVLYPIRAREKKGRKSASA